MPRKRRGWQSAAWASRLVACLLLFCEVKVLVFILVGSRCRRSRLGLVLSLRLLLLLNQSG
eukprot:scaffold4364_cov119-Isochrysis_galbana.AAC.15